MGKVIDIFTGYEVTQLPATVAEGESLIEHLIRYELRRSFDAFSGPVSLVNNLISMVENNSGASRYAVMDRIYKSERNKHEDMGSIDESGTEYSNPEGKDSLG